MKTVQNIYQDALVMKRAGLPPRDIASRLVDTGHNNDFALISERGGSHAIELRFETTGELIQFDGTDLTNPLIFLSHIWREYGSTPYSMLIAVGCEACRGESGSLAW